MRGGRVHAVGARRAARAARASRRRASRRRALALALALALAIARAIGSEADVGARPRTWEIWGGVVEIQWRCSGDVVEIRWRCSGDVRARPRTEQAAHEGGLYLPCISPASPLHLPYISPISPLYLAEQAADEGWLGLGDIGEIQGRHRGDLSHRAGCA